MHITIRITLAALLCCILAGCGGETTAPVATAVPASPAASTPRPTSRPGPTAAPAGTPQPAATAPPAPADGTLSVSDISAYKDGADYLNIFGMLNNQTGATQTAIRLEVHARDAAGGDLITEPDQAVFEPLVKTLLPGERAAFKYAYDIGDAEAASYEVVVKSSETTEQPRPELRVEHDQLIVRYSGSVFLVGELVNLSATPVVVEALAGAMFDVQQHLLMADAAEDMASYLAAAGDSQGFDRAPFLIPLGSSSPKGDTWSVYIDAHASDPQPAYDVSFNTSAVTAPDAEGYIHLVGRLKNNGADTLDTTLIAALYGEDGTVLDADAQPAGFRYIAPGVELPYDITFKVPDDGNMPPIARSSIQIDPSQTTVSTIAPVALTSADDALEQRDSAWFATGQAVNNSSQPVNVVDVVVTLVDGSGNLLAAAATRDYPDEDTIEPGASVAYETYFYAIPGQNMKDLTIKTFVQGYTEE